MTSQATIRASHLAAITGLSTKGIRKRANKEGWKHISKTCQGGKATHYFLDSLPEDLKQLVAFSQDEFETTETLVSKIVQSEKQRVEEAEKQKSLAKQESLAQFAALNEEKQKEAYLKLSILRAANELISRYGSKLKAWNTFCQEYNRSNVDLPEDIYKFKRSISYKTLFRWEKLFNEKGIIGLISNYGKRKGTGFIDSNPEMKEFCVALVHQYPHIKGARIRELLEMQFGHKAETPKESACRAWLSRWKEENKSVFLSLVDPSGWQNKHMVAFGSLSAEVQRINQLWEFDSTPADVMLTDGRFSIIGVIDVFTRRVKVVLKPSSNAEGISLLIRDAILDWGVPEVARTDNGQDYLSHHITTIWASLNIENDITNPYSGWEKPFIERFFRTFSHGMAEQLAGYIGHNVADREKINARLTFAERLMAKKDKGAGNENIDIALTSKEFESFINSWLEAHYHHNHHSELKCSPFEKYSQHKQSIKRLDDPRILDILLAPVPNQKGVRIVGKEGISVEGMTYIHAELGAHVGERVFCRYNPKDVGRIYVFDTLHMKFICEAVNPEIAGNEITRAHAQEARKVQRAALRESRKQIKKASKKYDLSDSAQRYLEFRAAQNSSLEAFPKPSTQIVTPGTESIAQIQDKPSGFSDEQKNRFAQRRKELDALAQSSTEPSFRDENHKARYYTEQNMKGRLGPVEKAWLHKWRAENRAAADMLDRFYQQTK